MRGLIIKESLADENILDLITMEKVEIWKAENRKTSQPKYWTAISFWTDSEEFIPKLSKSLINEDWYVDLSSSEEKIIVLKNNIIRYRLNDPQGKQEVMDYCRKIGIPESQIDWEE